MIHINLLPWRDVKREHIKKNFIRSLIITAISSVMISILIHAWLANKISTQQYRNNFLQTQATAYDQRIQQIGQLQRLRQEMAERMQIIQKVQTSRILIVHLFSTFIRIVPDGIYFTTINRVGNTINLSGKADSNAQISQLMRNIKNSAWLQEAKLKIIKTDEENPLQRYFDLQTTEKLNTMPNASENQ